MAYENFNPNNPKHLKQLKRSTEESRRKLDPFRRRRHEAGKEQAGYHYGARATEDRRPINFVELSTNIYKRRMTPVLPRVLIKTQHKQLKPSAWGYTQAVNRTMDRIHFADLIEELVLEGLMSWAIAKTGLCRHREMNIGGLYHDPGQVFIECVTLDNWIADMSAEKWAAMEFCGDKYRADYEYVMESGDYENTDQLNPTDMNDRGDAQIDGARASDISIGQGHNDLEFRKHIWLVDLWLPQTGHILTVPWRQTWEKPLNVVEWEGPDEGPYDTLIFQKALGNLAPLPPVAITMDLHLLANQLMNKVGRQAERQKTVTAYQYSSQDDAKNIVDAGDGMSVGVADTKAIKELKYGGAEAVSLALILTIKDLSSWFQGNLEALGGLARQSETIGQDEMLKGAASERLEEYKDKTNAFIRRRMRDIAWYVHTDPLIEEPFSRRVPGSNFSVPVTYSAAERRGDYLDYNYEIAPYSLQNYTPAQRVQILRTVLNDFIGPLMPFMAQQGIQLNVDRLMKLVGEYTSLTDLEEILLHSMPPTGFQPQGPIGQPPAGMKPATTTRRYVREGRPGATQKGQDQGIASFLFGKGMQPSEANKVTGG